MKPKFDFLRLTIGKMCLVLIFATLVSANLHTVCQGPTAEVIEFELDETLVESNDPHFLRNLASDGRPAIKSVTPVPLVAIGLNRDVSESMNQRVAGTRFHLRI